MLAPLFIESHAFLIQQERLQGATRRRRRRDPAPDRPARAWRALPLRALSHLRVPDPDLEAVASGLCLTPSTDDAATGEGP
jgi:hypothetical protein